jgi:hypothetical protein
MELWLPEDGRRIGGVADLVAWLGDRSALVWLGAEPDEPDLAARDRQIAGNYCLCHINVPETVKTHGYIAEADENLEFWVARRSPLTDAHTR